MTQTISDVDNWRDAVSTLVDSKVEDNECFSSGEIAKEIREQRPDIVFSVYDVGEFLRDLYYKDCFEYEVEFSQNPQPAYQVPRRTVGTGRTPAGVEVFVYAPSYEKAMDHDFEVNIPFPDRSLGNTSQYTEYGTEPDEDMTKNQSLEAVVATVHKDGRLCIPRKAFDELMHASRVGIQPGDRIHISLDQASEKVVVSMDQCAGSKSYDLTRDRGRVKYLPDTLQNWNSGERYKITIVGKTLVVDLSKAL